MRFAGQRFRNPKQGMSRFTEPSHAMGDMAYRYQSQGLPQSMSTMSEINAANFSKSGEPSFNIGSFAEPEFRA